MSNISKVKVLGTLYNIVDSAATAAVEAEVTRAKAAEAALDTRVSALESGIPSNIQEKLDTKFDAVSYDSANTAIQFKSGDTVKATLDASAFIKDGMVSSVALTDGYLVITFNTDAGKDPIKIAVSDIFNADNYYNKTEIDSKETALTEKIYALISVDGETLVVATAPTAA